MVAVATKASINLGSTLEVKTRQQTNLTGSDASDEVWISGTTIACF
jgi:hypothetical protein